MHGGSLKLNEDSKLPETLETARPVTQCHILATLL